MTDIVQLKDGTTLLYPKTHVKAVDGLVVPDAYTKTETNALLSKKENTVYKNETTPLAAGGTTIQVGKISRYGDIVTVYARIAGFTTGYWKELATLPTWAKPLQSITFPTVTYNGGGGRTIGSAVATPDGKLVWDLSGGVGGAGEVAILSVSYEGVAL